MKKFLTILVLMFLFLSPSVATAQIGGVPSCSPVTAQTYDFCCGVAAGNTNQIDCRAYQNGYSTPPPYVPGTLPGTGGGALNNNPVNSTQTITTTIADTPQTGSSQLQQCSSIKFLSLLDIMIWIKCIIVVAIIPLIFAAAFMFFLWGVMKFIQASDSTKKEEGKKFVIAGLIGLFVMTSVWGIIKIVSNTLGTGSAVPILQTTSLKK